jgi:hypothetical protein
MGRECNGMENNIKRLIHTSVALNTTKEEYIEANVTSPEALWLHNFPSWLFDLELEIKYHYI